MNHTFGRIFFVVKRARIALKSWGFGHSLEELTMWKGNIICTFSLQIG